MKITILFLIVIFGYDRLMAEEYQLEVPAIGKRTYIGIEPGFREWKCPDDYPVIKEWKYLNLPNESDVILGITWEVVKLRDIAVNAESVHFVIYDAKAMKLKEAAGKLKNVLHRTTLNAPQINKVIDYVKGNEALVRINKVLLKENEKLINICNDIKLCLKDIESSGNNSLNHDQVNKLNDLLKQLQDFEFEIAGLIKKYWGPPRDKEYLKRYWKSPEF